MRTGRLVRRAGLLAGVVDQDDLDRLSAVLQGDSVVDLGKRHRGDQLVEPCSLLMGDEPSLVRTPA